MNQSSIEVDTVGVLPAKDAHGGRIGAPAGPMTVNLPDRAELAGLFAKLP